jgi:hypothetical protein
MKLSSEIELRDDIRDTDTAVMIQMCRASRRTPLLGYKKAPNYLEEVTRSNNYHQHPST